MKATKIIFATGNRGKLREAAEILGEGFELLTPADFGITIARAKSGKGGFGYDPIFIPDEYPGLTAADITEEQKNEISHRGKALRAMAGYLFSIRKGDEDKG